MEKSESPTVFAKRVGLTPRKPAGGSSYQIVSWDHVLDLAVEAYWQRRRSNVEAA